MASITRGFSTSEMAIVGGGWVRVVGLALRGLELVWNVISGEAESGALGLVVVDENIRLMWNIMRSRRKLRVVL